MWGGPLASGHSARRPGAKPPCREQLGAYQKHFRSAVRNLRHRRQQANKLYSTSKSGSVSVSTHLQYSDFKKTTQASDKRLDLGLLCQDPAVTRLTEGVFLSLDASLRHRWTGDELLSGTVIMLRYTATMLLEGPPL